MFKEKYNVIGVMSGTSLDGVDLAYITFTKGTTWRFQIQANLLPCNSIRPHRQDPSYL
jgi:anhydro-N-acetylmuramic acid kinase